MVAFAKWHPPAGMVFDPENSARRLFPAGWAINWQAIDNSAHAIAHDPAGNVTKSPKPGNWTETFEYVWDAWNRLIAVKDNGTITAEYRYDGEHKRITKKIGNTTWHYYYSLEWQILEEQIDGEAMRQYVWSPGGMDDLVFREEGLGSSSSELGGRLYALNDLMNVTAVVDENGAVVERYGYDAFGESRVMDANFGSRSQSDYDWEIRYKGYFFDHETGLYQVRYRYLHSTFG
ncbi:MAG TPA: hypothetical protein VK041_08810 [Opitutales bacterium]|nr:hypothetical protein [Opitutales bacterium]